MPYTVGSFASVIMFFLMFAALRPHFVALREAALQNSGGVIMLRTMNRDTIFTSQSLAKTLLPSRAPFGNSLRA